MAAPSHEHPGRPARDRHQVTQAATLAVAILACVAPFLGNQKKGGLFGTPRLAETFGDDHLDNPYLERRLQAGNGTGSNGGCLRNAWGRSQICDFDDENCKYKLPEACTSKFTCPAGYYCTAGAYAAASKEDAEKYFAADWPSYGTQCMAVNLDGTDVDAGDGNTWYGYACECQNGFWCPENIVIPNWCPQSYECQRPSQRKKCPQGRWCKQGTVRGWPCTFGQDCKKGTIAPPAGAVFLIYFVIIVLIGYAVFWFRDRARSKRLEKSNKEMQDYYDVLHSKDSTEVERRAATDSELKSRFETGDDKDVEDGYRIEFSDLRLTLPGGATVMRGPSGALECGKSTAIMGASGAGKTTIMNLITGKVKKTGGWITVNGEPCDDLSQYRSRTAFVPQEDVMHRELTVLDNITFSANMRLPANWTEEQKREKVMHTIYTLDLTHVQHSIIGDEFERGISGGQRKRVNVGLELVADPKILFLDEPTSGLDSVSATKLCKILRDIAEKQRLTVAAVIHSPGPEAFMSFHNFLLLQTGGRLVYYGPMPKVEQYFEDIGFKYPRDETLTPLADHVLLKVSGEGDPSPGAKIKLKAGDTWDHLTGFTKLWHMKQGLEPPCDADEAPEKVGRAAATWASLKHSFTEMPSQYKTLFCPGRGDADRPTISSGYTFFICFRRACNQNYTTFWSFFFSIVVFYGAVGFFFASLFTIGDDPPNVLGGYPSDICSLAYPALRSNCKDLQSNQFFALMGSIVFIQIAMAAATTSATFGCETAQYWRECSVGLNTPAYFFAKSAADLPLCVVSAMAIWAPFASIFATPVSKGNFFVVLLLLNLFGYVSGYFISFLVPYNYCGLTSVAWGVWWGLLFNGFNMPIHFQPALKFIYYVSAPRWYMEGWFDVSTVYPYKRVRSGKLKGEPYYRFGIGRAQRQYAFWNRFPSCMGYMILCIMALYIVDLVIITVTQVNKKK
mmetsp:Transcript_26760/g.80819  ORF Transcript_26760/g.80819 Transcript_26760/m.80819 type:complete len:958 (-) Transcript_26760:85-2958(-)